MKCNEGNKNIGYYTSGIKRFICYFQKLLANPQQESAFM